MRQHGGEVDNAGIVHGEALARPLDLTATGMERIARPIDIASVRHGDDHNAGRAAKYDHR